MDGLDGLEDQVSRPRSHWNRIPDDILSDIIDLALGSPELLPRELAVRFTDDQRYFVSESSVYRLLKARDLITSPAFIVMKAANEFKDKTTAIADVYCGRGQSILNKRKKIKEKTLKQRRLQHRQKAA